MSGGDFLLNHDCWWQILQYLQLPDQIKLRQSGAPFGPIIDEYWQRKVRTLEVRGGVLPDCQEWNVLVGSICRTVEVLKLYCLSREHFDVLLLHTFPRAVDFRFSPMQSHTITDDDVLPLSKAFPNLRTFSPSGRLTGRGFWLFRHLTHLTLTYCRCMQIENIVRLLQEVPVKSIHFDTTDWNEHNWISCLVGSDLLVLFRLEEISLSQSEWKELTDYWKHLLNNYQHHDSGIPSEIERGTDKQFRMVTKPGAGCSAMQEREDRRHEVRAAQFFANLKCLTVTEWLKSFCEFVQPFKHKRIIAIDMEYHGSDEFCELYQLGQMEHLRQISLYSMTIKCAADNLGNLQNLQEICLFNCLINYERHIWNLLRNSTRLKRLSIEYCAMGFPVLHVSDDNLATARSSPLTLNFFGNYMQSLMPLPMVCDCTSSRCEVTSIKPAKRSRVTSTSKWVCFYFE